MTDDLREVRTSLDGLRNAVAKVDVELTRVSAVLAEVRDRQSNEIGALFDAHKDHAGRIGEIERQYTPMHEHRRTEERNTAEHAEFRTALTEQRVSVARLLVVAAILAALGSATLTASAMAVMQRVTAGITERER